MVVISDPSVENLFYKAIADLSLVRAWSSHEEGDEGSFRAKH